MKASTLRRVTWSILSVASLLAVWTALSTPAAAVPPGPTTPTPIAAWNVVLPMNPPGRIDPKAEALAAEKYAGGEMAATSGGGPGGAGGGRTKVRTLFDFEAKADGSPIQGYEVDGKPVEALKATAENLDAVYVQDRGVTGGKWCARLTIPAGKDYGSLEFVGPTAKDWSDYDYFAIDVNTEEPAPINIVLELWDQDSKDYATRCTFETVVTRPGSQTLLYQINRAKRNGKEGRAWPELEPKDKIDMNRLKKVRFFMAEFPDRPIRLWVDNIRLMQEDAAKPKMNLPLPKAAIAFDFCPAGAVVPGFKAVTATTRLDGEALFGFVVGEHLAEGGLGWPDLLSGTFITAGNRGEDQPREPGARMEFKAKVPPGKYVAWLCAGPLIEKHLADSEYLLQLNDKILYQDKPDYKAIESQKYLYRFLWTQYSERPHALWLDYVDRMYPVYQQAVDAPDGVVTLTASNFFISAMILVPAAEQPDFDRMAAKIQQVRLATFEKSLYIPEDKKPQPAPGASGVGGDGDYLLYVPSAGSYPGPSDGPSAQERKQTSVSQVAARGQNVIIRLAVVPFKDLGACELMVSDLVGPDVTRPTRTGVAFFSSEIPAADIKGHLQNWRRSGRDVSESILLPILAFNGEKEITQSLWLWLTVPQNAKPGKYSGTFTFTPSNGKSTPVPVSIDVLPIKLEPVVPVAYGMYYGGRSGADMPKEAYWALIEDQLKWMQKVGFTGANLMVEPTVTGMNGDRVTLTFDETMPKLLKKLGFGRHPAQQQMTSQLGVARAIGRRLGAKVDANPGCEFNEGAFIPAYKNAIAQYYKFLEGLGLPYACEVVDEPRDVPNPWNRNVKDTCRYGDLMGETGFKTRFVTPMGDSGGASSNLPLVESVDIISIHAGPGSKQLQEKTLATPGKTLWYYNTGMSRYMWGFQPWSVGVKGRWEWHWCAPDAASVGGYPGGDWYNPFTGQVAFASNAPVGQYPGGFLYQSSFLTVADGITDYSYLYTLENAIARNTKADTKMDAVRKAEGFIKRVKTAVPPLAHGDLPAENTAAGAVDAWRAQAAACLAELQAP